MSREESIAAPTAAQTTRSRGQSLVELALVAPIMILLLGSLVQFGLIFERQVGINNAVREAPRRGATLDTTTVGQAQTNANWALTELQAALANSQSHETSLDRGLEVCYFTPAAPNNVDPLGHHQVFIRVHAGYAHPLFLPIIDLILDPIDGSTDRSLRVDTEAEFRVEQAGDYDIGTGAYARTSSSTTPCAQ